MKLSMLTFVFDYRKPNICSLVAKAVDPFNLNQYLTVVALIYSREMARGYREKRCENELSFGS